MKLLPNFRPFPLLAFAILGLAVFSAPAATPSGATGSHDPSRMILCNGKYYVYSTGGGMKFSTDGITWTAGASPFAAFADETQTPAPGARPGRRMIPPSAKAVLPANQGIWAPDIIFYNDKYYLYYSVAGAKGIDRCGIGLLTSPTLDPAAADYKWTDAGMVIVTDNKAEKMSAIDAAPFVDAKGDLWMAWGSGYANGATWDDPTIIISKLDNATGLRSQTDTTHYPVAPGHIEAAYIHYRAGFYYAFWNDGGCCNGMKSTYRIHVARSATVTGIYVNRAGTTARGGDTFMSTVAAKEIYGPGHMGIASEPGLDRFSFHYYNSNSRPVLGVRTLVWRADGWPSVGEDLAPGTYKIATEAGQVLGVRGNSLAEGALLELQPDSGGDFQKWTVEITPEGYYLLKSVGSGKSFQLAAPATSTRTAPGVIAQATTGNDNHQQWIIELASDGKTYRVKSRATQETLALPASAVGVSAKSSALTTAVWSNLPAQRWIFSAQ